MFVVEVRKSSVRLKTREIITSGSVNVYRMRFDFNDSWKPEYKRYAIFRVMGKTATVPLDEKNMCVIPWELTTKDFTGGELYCGVNGRLEDGSVILPTAWFAVGTIVDGADISDTVPRPSHKSAYDEVLDALRDKGDSLDYEDEILTLRSGERALSSVRIETKLEYATKEDILSLL